MSDKVTLPLSDEFALFLDTNTLLHYPALSQFDWKSVCRSNQVRLVFCLQVISELDDKKDDSRLGVRAQKRIRELRELRRSNTVFQEGVSVEVFNYQPRSQDFPETLSHEAKDDRIVHSVLTFSKQNPAISVAVYSEDMGMALRCEAHGILVVEPDSGVRLANPESEQQKKHRLAVTELNELKKRVPELELIVTTTHVTQPVKQPAIFEVTGHWEDHDVAAELQKYVANAELHAMNKEEIAGGGLIPKLPQKQDAVHRYNDKLAEHVEEYGKWLKYRAMLEKIHAHLFRFQLWIKNTGNVPAEDIDLVIDIPNVLFTLFPDDTEEAKQLVLPEPPKAPIRPTHFFVDFCVRDHFGLKELELLKMERIFNNQASVEQSEDGQSFRIRYSTKRLKHHDTANCGTMIAVLAPDKIRPFEMTYHMSAANLTNLIQGKIPMIVKKADETA